MYMRQSPKQYRVKHSIIAKEQRFYCCSSSLSHCEIRVHIPQRKFQTAPSTKLSSILCPYIIMLLKKIISRYTKHCFSRCKCKLIVTILMSSWNANINEDDIFLINLNMKIFNYPLTQQSWRGDIAFRPSVKQIKHWINY